MSAINWFIDELNAESWAVDEVEGSYDFGEICDFAALKRMTEEKQPPEQAR